MTNSQAIASFAHVLSNNPQEIASDMVLALVGIVVTSPRHEGVTNEQIRDMLHTSIDAAFDHAVRIHEAVK